jgi:uncharacterized protein
MEANWNEATVTHNEKAHRFELYVDGLRSMLTYRRYPDRIIFDHTEVPQAQERHGLAAKLASAALEFARQNHLRVVPICRYVVNFLKKHPEQQDLVSAKDREKLLSN